MKKLIDINEEYLLDFRRIVSSQVPEKKITDKELINVALFLAFNCVNNGNFSFKEGAKNDLTKI